MEFQKAAPSDLGRIFPVYQAAIARMEELGIHQWDEVYPSKEIISEDIENREMYIGLTDGNIVSAFTLNRKFDPEYEGGRWQYEGLAFSVLHRLCVRPACQNKGAATQSMEFIEETLRREGFASVRLDAFSRNPAALRLYEKFGYTRVGEAAFRKGLCYLYEKGL